MSPSSKTSPIEFSSAVVAHLINEGKLVPTTLEQFCDIIKRFGDFAQHGLGIASIDAVEPRHAELFLDSLQVDGSPPGYGDRKIRRTALRRGFKTGRKLGLVKGDPTLDLEIGPPSHLSARPLTDEEIEAARAYAVSSPRDRRRSIAWALAEATARTAEIGTVRVCDVDLTAGCVWLPGTATTDPRLGYFTEWGLRQVRRRIESGADPAASLVVWRSEPKVPRAASSQAIKESLKAAGLVAPDISPRSVVAWAGRKLFDGGSPLDEVARRLGMRSLDQVAAFIGFSWRQVNG